MKTSRRIFIKQALAGSTLLASGQWLHAGRQTSVLQETAAAPSVIRLALIGKGGMGTADTNTALMVEGVKLTAVCDLYDKRLEDAKRSWGDNLFTTKDYKEILKRDDVDVVIVATPDHWHQPISIEAMKAGKHVYCEKPVVHKVEEIKELVATQQQTGCYFQPGSQGMASLGNRKARQLVLSGLIGKVNSIEAKFTAVPTEPGKYSIPADASEKTIWWERFLGNAPKHPFQPQRFFYWRNWKEYGTGIAGDLFVHVLASVNFITDSNGPDKIYTTGGIYHYTDGYRDTPDIMMGYFDYPDKNNVGAFTLSLSANYVDAFSKEWGSTYFKITGNKGMLEVGWDKVVLHTIKDADLRAIEELPAIGQGIDQAKAETANKVVFQTENGYKGGHYDHFNNFFKAIRTKSQLTADVMFAVQSAAPALLSYKSYQSGLPVYWDSGKLKISKNRKRR